MFRIDDDYTEFDSASLEPGRFASLSFPGWQATQNGYHAVACSLLTDDDQPADDIITDSFLVFVGGDVGVSRLIAPTGEIDSGDTFTPIAMVKNYGQRAQRFRELLHQLKPQTAAAFAQGNAKRIFKLE